jgi:hypothetical protein
MRKDHSKTVTVMGKRYRVSVQSMPFGTRGECDHPETRGKEIRIQDGMGATEFAEVLIHEMAHAADWHKDEEWVEQFAQDVVAALAKFGLLKDG